MLPSAFLLASGFLIACWNIKGVQAHYVLCTQVPLDPIKGLSHLTECLLGSVRFGQVFPKDLLVLTNIVLSVLYLFLSPDHGSTNSLFPSLCFCTAYIP